MTARLLAAFEKSSAALEALVSAPEFDINALNRLVETRGHIVAEIVAAGLDADTLRELHTRHAALEARIQAARDAAERRLGRMRAGDKVLDAYRR